MASSRVPEADRKAVAAAFIGMASDPKGRDILREASRSVGIVGNGAFVASDGSEYASYRKFYETAPAQLR
jgi:phosphonate transport system substrate-binding protein